MNEKSLSRFFVIKNWNSAKNSHKKCCKKTGGMVKIILKTAIKSLLILDFFSQYYWIYIEICNFDQFLQFPNTLY